jgi:chromosome segregation ATPase
MIRDMLKKLEATHAQEAKKNEWCVSEMDKTTKSQHNKQEWVIKLKDRIGAMDAEIEELTDDIKTTNEELNEMQEVTSVATKVRNSENTRAGGAIQQYKDAQSMITTAMEVLKKFYSAAPDLPGGETAKEGLGAGIIGILEIAVQDFADLQEETEQSEATAAEQYKQLMQESEVKVAVFKKDLEYKSRNKVKIEGERMNAASDMKSYEKELTAIEGYLEKLKATCIAKPDSYEERKARREKELAGLKEALQYLGNGR